MNPAEIGNISEAEGDFWWYRGMRRILFGLLDPIAKNRTVRRALEAGCGTGYNASLFEERYQWPVCALDLEAFGLRHARQRELSRLVQGDLASLPFASEAFDVVISLDVIVHFPRGEEKRAIAELARVLAPGGLLVLRVSALDSLRSRHSEFACERQRFTSRRLLAAVREQKIRVMRCTYANSLLLPVALAKFRLWEPLLQRRPQSGVRPVSPWLNRLLEVPLNAESRWIASGHNMPLGQSLILIGEKAA